MSPSSEGPSRSDGPEHKNFYSSQTSTIVVDKSSNEKVIPYPTSTNTKKQSSLLLFLKPFITNQINVHAQNTITEYAPEHNMAPHCPVPAVQPLTSHHITDQNPVHTTATTTSPQPRVTHKNPYKPQRRLQQPVRISSTITSQQHSIYPAADGSAPQRSHPATQSHSMQQNSQPTAPPPPQPIVNPYKKNRNPPPTPFTEQALRYCPDTQEATPIESEAHSSINASLESLSVRRTRSRLVYRPERLKYHSLGN